MKTLSYLLLGLLLLTGCSKQPQAAPKEYLIEGNIETLPDSCVIQLLKCCGNQYRTVKLCTVIDGKFSFRATLSHTQHYGIKGRGYIHNCGNSTTRFLSNNWRTPYFRLRKPIVKRPREK